MSVEAIRLVASFSVRFAPSLVPELLPEGRRQGGEWWSRNPTRADRNLGSFSVSLKDGRWNDFSSGDRGGDLVSLAAFVLGSSQTDAAIWIARRLGLDLPELEGRPGATDADLQRQLQNATRESEARTLEHVRQMQERQQAAAEKAQCLWRDARRADPEHGYLRLKRLAPMALHQRGSELLVPLFLNGALINLQMITPDGGKRFLSGGRVKGAYAAIGRRENASQLYICEGYATGATLHQHTGQPVACAMNAGNLLPVATALRERYGQTFELVIAGDDDRQTDGNPGRTAANAAALANGAKVVFPDWPEGAPDHLSDFNDLAVWSARHE
ncbi:toprim domain-containing protein [Pseudomonas sp. EpS/L25]|uniref:toprim domain-containing protein n=1 Tax=Pseudomonas sp. EpS/L25 TaxID=1749078 RepID=UPI0007439F73|nr:toprim domain-containing protein [Pseudomonas sp. EpS/L25]KUM42491.1 hypothetical protein AR540_01565 [Pseudomonas sp. EpS/L25]